MLSTSIVFLALEVVKGDEGSEGAGMMERGREELRDRAESGEAMWMISKPKKQKKKTKKKQ